MPIPPMKPDAKVRAEALLGAFPTLGSNRAVEIGLTAAYGDGYAANDRAERMLAVLREPLHNDIRRLTFATCPDTQSLQTCLCVNGVSSRCWDRGQAAIAVLHDILAEVAAQEPGQ